MNSSTTAPKREHSLPEIGIAVGVDAQLGQSLRSELTKAARAAEEEGLASWWTLGDREQAEHGHDGPLALVAVACATRSLRLGLGGDVLPAHIPPGRAKQVATLDFFSRGRVEYTVDLADAPVGLVWPRSSDEDPIGQSREYLEAMARLWSTSRATFDGDRVSFRGAIALLRTVADRIPPIHLRGASTQAVKRSLRSDVSPPAGSLRGRLPS